MGEGLKIKPKKWEEFQHYKDRNPTWIKLHRKLLDDVTFQRLPRASQALAPMLWLMASEHPDGVIDAAPDDLAFRLRWSQPELTDALSPLIGKGFFDVVQFDSKPLATVESAAIPERYKPEAERERETQPPEQAHTGVVSTAPTPAPPRAAEFPKGDDPRVTALHGIACAARCRASVLDAQQWVSEGITEAQLLEATSRAKAKKPGEVIPVKFLQCFVNDVKAGVGSAAGYDAEAVRNATIAAINAKEGHATH